MKRRHVRPDDWLDDLDELILRGGELKAGLLRQDAQRMFDIYGIYGISVFALRGATVDELAQQPPLVRFPKLTIVAVRALQRAHLRLEPTGRNRRHYTLVLDKLDDGVAAFCNSEHQTWTNPYHE